MVTQKHTTPRALPPAPIFIQVATSGVESGTSGGGSGIGASELSSSTAAKIVPSRPPQLVRARSGPATLSHAVFEMLYVELRSVLGGLRRARTARARERAKAKMVKAKKARSDADAAAAAVAVAACTSAATQPSTAAVEESGEGKQESDVVGSSADPTGRPEGDAPAAVVPEEGARQGVNDEPIVVAGVGTASSGTAGEAEIHGQQGQSHVDDKNKDEDEQEEDKRREEGEKGEANGDEQENGLEEEERAVFEKLADMRDDLGCLTLSRELQVGVGALPLLLVSFFCLSCFFFSLPVQYKLRMSFHLALLFFGV